MGRFENSLNFRDKVWVLVLLVLWSINGCDYFSSEQTRLDKAKDYIAQSEYGAASVELRKLLQKNDQNVEARYLLGRSSLFLGLSATAEKEFRKAIKLGWTDEKVYVDLGVALLGQGAYEELLAEITGERVKTSSLKAQILVQRGDANLAKNSIDVAQKNYQEALNIEPGLMDAEIGLGRIERLLGDMDGAKKRLSVVLKNNPDHVKALLERGEIKLGEKEYNDAIDSFAAVVRLAESQRTIVSSMESFSALNGLVISQLSAGKVDDGKQTIDRMVKRYVNHPQPYYLRALQAYGDNDLQAAANDLLEALNRAPKYTAAQILLGAIYLAQGNYEQADMFLNDAVMQEPADSRARRMLAATKLKLRQPEEAISTLSPLLSEDSDDNLTLDLLAQAQLQLGNIDSGISYIEQGIAGNPGNPALQLELATAYLQTDRLEQAIDTLERLPGDDESSYRRDLLLIVAYMRQQDVQRALEKTNMLIKKYPDDSQVHVLAGRINMLTKDTEQSRKLFKKALELDPENSSAYSSLARLELSQKNPSAAIDLLEKLQKINPGDSNASSEVMLMMANAVALAGRKDEVSVWLDRAVEAEPGNIIPKMVKLKYLIATKDFVAAEKFSEIAIKKHPKNAEIVSTAALSLYRQDKKDKALKVLETAVKQNPDSAVLHYELAVFYELMERPVIARSEYQKAQAISPDSVAIAVRFAHFEFKQGSQAKAFELADNLQFHLTDHPAGTILKGDLYALSRRPADAMKAYQKAVKLHGLTRELVLRQYRVGRDSGAPVQEVLHAWLEKKPDDAEIRFLLAQELQGKKQISAAREQYERVITDLPENYIALNNLAWLYFLQKDDRAVEMAKKAHQLKPDAGAITDTLGWILYKSGNKGQGLQLLKQANQQMPNTPDIQYHLAAAHAAAGEVEVARELLNQILAGKESFESRWEAEQLRDTLN